MIHEPSAIAVVVFLVFVAITLGLSFYLGRRAKTSQGYFAAHGQIPWFVNGVAFAGDYLSAASFLGICGMIASYGYDGFLYSIGYLAGWIVALFVVAEPLKRLGKFTFADALDARFQSSGIRLAGGVSTLVVSLFYLIPQMVGAGVLIQPLLGLPHWAGVLAVGTTVIVIVVTAGMVSTTWVQFLKGALLVVFSAILTYLILNRGFTTARGGADGYAFRTLGPFPAEVPTDQWKLPPEMGAASVEVLQGESPSNQFAIVTTSEVNASSVWKVEKTLNGEVLLREAQTTSVSNGQTFINGKPKGSNEGEAVLHPVGHIATLPDGAERTGPLDPISFLRIFGESDVVLWGRDRFRDPQGQLITVYYQKPTRGERVLRPGEHPSFKGIRSNSLFDKLDFLSLMLALFCGTASLPHILIRYYTVKDATAARKSTIVGIASIGFFYVLTLYIGLGAMTSGALDVTNDNMAAPLLARSISEWLFAIISAIAFTTVLGTVSGLILASAGAVSHDLLANLGIKLSDYEQVRVAKIASVGVGAIAIALGIFFKELNVSYLVGWAFSIAASANLPSLVMILFWKGVTKQGVTAAVVVGMISSLGWILLSADTYGKVYGLSPSAAIVPFSQPGIVTIPLGFATLIGVSLATRKSKA